MTGIDPVDVYASVVCMLLALHGCTSIITCTVFLGIEHSATSVPVVCSACQGISVGSTSWKLFGSTDRTFLTSQSFLVWPGCTVVPGSSSVLFLRILSLSSPPFFLAVLHFLYLLIHLNLVCVLFPHVLFLALDLSVTFLLSALSPTCVEEQLASSSWYSSQVITCYMCMKPRFLHLKKTLIFLNSISKQPFNVKWNRKACLLLTSPRIQTVEPTTLATTCSIREFDNRSSMHGKEPWSPNLV